MHVFIYVVATPLCRNAKQLTQGLKFTIRLHANIHFFSQRIQLISNMLPKTCSVRTQINLLKKLCALMYSGFGSAGDHVSRSRFVRRLIEGGATPASCKSSNEKTECHPKTEQPRKPCAPWHDGFELVLKNLITSKASTCIVD